MDRASASGVARQVVNSLLQGSATSGFIRQPSESNHRTSPLRHSRLFSSPNWSGVFRSEKILRRVIPILIVTLLTLVAAAKTLSLISHAYSLEQFAKREIKLVSKVTIAKLQADAALKNALISPTIATALLEDALPASYNRDGQMAFLLDAEQTVVASRNAPASLDGVKLFRLTGGNKLMSTLGATAGVLDISVDGNVQALGQFTAIKGADGTIAGGILIAHSKNAIFVNWRQSVKLNIILFLATSTVMLVILFAYFSQGARAREADALFTETNARVDTALARGHCGLWDWDLARGRIVWSASMFQMLGMEQSDRVMSYGELSGLLHADDPDLKSLANGAFNSDHRQIDHRFRIMHASGTWVWVRIRAELVRYKRADPHLIGIAVDITEQEAIKQQSKDADIRLRDAIENISEAFVLWDSKHRLVMCNTKYQQLYNLPASSVTSGARHEDVMAQSRKPRIRTQVSSGQAQENGSKTFEAQIENGSWLQINERRTRDGGFVSVGTDITQIKRNETKLVDSERKLISTVTDLRKSQRQLEYQAQQLVELADDLSEQKNKAEAGNKAKSEFLANISHELRTPLNAIIGFSDIMRANMFGPLGSEKYHEYADDIHDSGNFLLNVINDVLDMSKIEAGRFEINPEGVDLNGLLEETLRIIHIQAEKGQLQLDHQIPPNLSIEADRRAVKQILLNLLSNAVKFTGEGGTIKVTAVKKRKSVKISIEDNGIGISPEALERLGRPFEQVQDQFTKNHKGSGLGLAIARSLANLHGGDLSIKSAEGVGTTIAVILPIKCKMPETVDQPEQEATEIAA
ncbi:MAG: ATP-binding protein [Pseudomonadota bacterium]